MNSKSRINDKTASCEKSLVFRFIRIARWIALFLLLGIGVLGTSFQYERHHDIDWMFFTVCAVCGIMLFWMGRCILKSECNNKRGNGKCRRHTQTVNPSEINRTILNK